MPSVLSPKFQVKVAPFWFDDAKKNPFLQSFLKENSVVNLQSQETTVTEKQTEVSNFLQVFNNFAQTVYVPAAEKV